MEIDKNQSGFEDAVYNEHIEKWLPHLQIKNPHPLDPDREEKLRKAKEIFNFFRQEYPEKSYKEFTRHITMLPPIERFKTKEEQVYDAVLLLRLSKRVKRELQEIGIQ